MSTGDSAASWGSNRQTALRHQSAHIRKTHGSTLDNPRRWARGCLARPLGRLFSYAVQAFTRLTGVAPTDYRCTFGGDGTRQPRCFHSTTALPGVDLANPAAEAVPMDSGTPDLPVDPLEKLRQRRSAKW